MSFTEFYSEIFHGNTQRYIEGELKEGKKVTTMPKGNFPVQSHLDPNNKKFFGRSPIFYTKEGKGLCRWIGFDRDEDVEDLKACKSAWAIDTELFPFKSTSGRWHYYKFFDEPIDVLRAKEIKDKLVEQFKKLGWTIDKDKCLPQGFDLEEKTPGNHLYLPRFYDGTSCYSPRGEKLDQKQFQFRYEHRKHPLISGSVGLESGQGETGGRQKVLFNVALYLRHTGYKPMDFLDEVNQNFNEPEVEKELQHAKGRGIKEKYDLKYFVNHYAKYTEALCGWALGLSEALIEVLEEPSNAKILKSYEPPENASEELTFQNRIVYCKKEDLFFDLYTWDEYKKNAINNTFQHLFSKKPELIYSKNPDKLIVESTAFRPEKYNQKKPIFEEDKKLYLNDYRPIGVDMLGPDECDLYDFYIGEFLTLVGNIFIDKEDLLDYFLDFFANIIQRPGEKIRQIPFISSKQKQIGKGLMFLTIQKALHKDHVKTINTRTALDKGMTFLHRSLFVNIDEVYLKGDYKQMRLLMDRIKLLATQQEHSVRTLYQDERTIYSNTNFIMFSNYPDAIDFDEHEERYFYINSKAQRLSDNFYKDYYYDYLMDGQLAECVKHFLFHRKIKTYADLTSEEKDEEGKPRVPLFSASGTAYKTEDFYDRAKTSGTLSHQIVKQLVKEFEEPFRYDVVAISEVHKYLTREYPKYNESLNVLAEAFEELKFTKLGEAKHKRSGKKPTLWIVRDEHIYSKIAHTTIADEFWIPMDLDKYDMDEAHKRDLKNKINIMKDEKVPF